MEKARYKCYLLLLFIIYFKQNRVVHEFTFIYIHTYTPHPHPNHSTHPHTHPPRTPHTHTPPHTKPISNNIQQKQHRTPEILFQDSFLSLICCIPIRVKKKKNLLQLPLQHIILAGKVLFNITFNLSNFTHVWDINFYLSRPSNKTIVCI